jgi:hypothetical protein
MEETEGRAAGEGEALHLGIPLGTGGVSMVMMVRMVNAMVRHPAH